MGDENFLIIYFFLIFGGKFSAAKQQPHCEYDFSSESYSCWDVVDRFPKLQSDDLDGYDLKCENCKIKSLSEASFAPNTKCTTLYLNNNSVQYLLPKAFFNLPSIQFIYLENNKISNISIGAFDGMKQVEQIHLEGNAISEMVPGSLRGLDCTYVYLGGNMIDQVPNNAFQGIVAVMLLELHSNRIRELHYDSFAGLENLETLELQNNRLCDLPVGVFRHLKSLKQLNLSGNKFARLSPSHFSGLKSLNYLALANNLLTEFDEKILLSFYEIKELDLSKNGIYSMVAGRIYDSAPTLKILYLEDNFFSCSLLAEVLTYFKGKRVKVEYDPGRFDVQNINGVACIDQEITASISFKYFLQKAQTEGTGSKCQ